MTQPGSALNEGGRDRLTGMVGNSVLVTLNIMPASDIRGYDLQYWYSEGKEDLQCVRRPQLLRLIQALP